MRKLIAPYIAINSDISHLCFSYLKSKDATASKIGVLYYINQCTRNGAYTKSPKDKSKENQN